MMLHVISQPAVAVARLFRYRPMSVTQQVATPAHRPSGTFRLPSPAAGDLLHGTSGSAMPSPICCGQGLLLAQGDDK
jgi:hypothetical protein